MIMKYFYTTLLIVLIGSIFCTASVAQSRDYLTDEEIEMVRNAQQIDKRMEVLVHAMDRRFGVLKVEVGSPVKKEVPDWGALPEGTRFQLLNDIKRIMEKAIDDIDNLAQRPDSMVIEEPEKGKKPVTYGELFPKGVRNLAAAAERYKVPLRRQLDIAKDGAEKGVIMASLDMCEQVTAAVAKLPPPAKKTGN